jgi:excinuclease UvrABC helicase subunit UvrB
VNPEGGKFQSEGIAAAHLDHRTPHDERALLFDAFRRRDIRMLISVGVLAMGFDVPDVGCVILADDIRFAIKIGTIGSWISLAFVHRNRHTTSDARRES